MTEDQHIRWAGVLLAALIIGLLLGGLGVLLVTGH